MIHEIYVESYRERSAMEAKRQRGSQPHSGNQKRRKRKKGRRKTAAHEF